MIYKAIKDHPNFKSILKNRKIDSNQPEPCYYSEIIFVPSSPDDKETDFVLINGQPYVRKRSSPIFFNNAFEERSQRFAIFRQASYGSCPEIYIKTIAGDIRIIEKDFPVKRHYK